MNGQRRIDEAELHAYVDGELAKEERAEVEALLAAAPAEFAHARELAALNADLQARYAGRLGEPLPDRMLALVRHIPKRSTALARGTSVAVAASLMLAITAAAAGYLGRGLIADARQPEAAFVTTALNAHAVYVPEVRHPVEVGADEEAHLVRWLTKRIGADVQAPALGTLGWKLVGGRLLPDQGQPAAQFMYEDASGRRLTLYVRKETGLNNTAFRFAERGSFSAFYWVDQPLAYALSGRVSRGELTEIANAVYAQLEAHAAAKAQEQPAK